MKITPYLLALNGFDPYEGRKNCFERINTSVRNGLQIRVNIEPTGIQGAWMVNYTAPGVICHLYVKEFHELQSFLELISKNRLGYEDIQPVLVGIPKTYFEKWWSRGNFDQDNFDQFTYKYKNE